MPKLLGAPAYSRPARPYAPTPRPFDPDELPLEALWTDEERALIMQAQARERSGADENDTTLRPRGGGLRFLASRLLRSA